MIYFLVTTSIYNDCLVRKERYLNALRILKEIIETKCIQPSKIIIIENNGKRPTYFDDQGCEVYYTNNNSLPVKNIGHKELSDVLDCLKHYNIQDDDFVVKITGRYIIDEDSEFIKALMEIDTKGYDCIVRYGPFFKPVNFKVADCITGLIGMRCRFMKQIEKPTDEEWVEWKWGRATYLIDDSKIYVPKMLGVYICPENKHYFMV